MIALAIFALLLSGAMLTFGPSHTLDSRLYYTAQQAADYMNGLTAEQSSRYFYNELADFVFITTYSSFLFLALKRLYPKSKARYLAFIPGSFDIVETAVIAWCTLHAGAIESFPWLGLVTLMKWLSGGAVVANCLTALEGRAPIEKISLLKTSQEAVWTRVTTPEGINHELAPFLRMTMPEKLVGKTIRDIQVGAPIGRSWILLFGVLPVEYDDLKLVELAPGAGFLENSTMLCMRAWSHERRLAQTPDGCELRDRVGFELRTPLRCIPGAQSITRAIVSFLFSHRHRRLRAWFNRKLS